MRTLIRYALPLVLCLSLVAPVQAASSVKEKDPYHVMYTDKKGKARCMNKGSREKADKCATKLQGKGATNVQVMAGKCSSM
jgi:hypothetical protein